MRPRPRQDFFSQGQDLIIQGQGQCQDLHEGNKTAWSVYFIEIPPPSGTGVNGWKTEGQWQTKIQEASSTDVGSESIILKLNECNNDTNTTVDFIRTFDWLGWSAYHFHQLLAALNYTKFLHHKFAEVNLTVRMCAACLNTQIIQNVHTHIG